MAYRVATADGNLTTAGTWGAVDATSLLDSQANNTLLTTTPTGAAAGVTPGAITIDAIAVKIATRATTPTGTMTVVLRNVTDAVDVAGTSVTINVSDIPDDVGTAGTAVTGCSVGWFLLKLAAPVLLVAGKAYNVRASTSSANMVNLFRDATASNWSRMLRTTTTAAPGAGDSMFVLGEWTAAATKTNRVVTMDSLIGTDYGGASTTLASLGVGKGGTFQFGNTAATAYVFRISGVIQVWLEGIFTIGTVASPIPRDGSASLEFDCAATGDFGLISYGTVVMQGLSRTSGKNISYCRLNTDEAAGQTVLGVDTDTGWLSGDVIAVTTTTRTRTEGEERTLASDAGAGSVTVTAGLTNAHGGTAPVQAEVVLLTRNVRVYSTLSTAGAYQHFASGTLDVDWTSFQYMYGTTVKCAAYFNGATAVAFDYVVFRNTTSGIIVNSTLSAASWSHLHFWGVTGSTEAILLSVAFALTLTDSVFSANINAGTPGGITTSFDLTLALTRCYFSATPGAGITLNGTTWGTLDACGFHCCGGTGSTGAVYSGDAIQELTFTDCSVWRNVTAGAGMGAIYLAGLDGTLRFVNCLLFGNLTSHIGIGVGAVIEAIGCTFAGDTSFATAAAFLLGNRCQAEIRILGGSVGVASGIYVAHTTADFNDNSVTAVAARIVVVNAVLGSATEFSSGLLAAMMGRSSIGRQRKDGTTNTHETVYPRLGTVAYETSTFRTAAPSERLTPSGATSTFKLRSAVKRAPIAATKVLTVTVHVRKDAGYTGSAPRLIARANPALGYDSDTVLDTLSVGSGVWEQLTGTTTPAAEEAGVMEFYVDCDGSAGNVYVDDWSAQQG